MLTFAEGNAATAHAEIARYFALVEQQSTSIFTNIK